ncbi:hypothetical protein Tco_0970406 [Tanacetum coccineum]
MSTRIAKLAIPLFGTRLDGGRMHLGHLEARSRSLPLPIAQWFHLVWIGMVINDFIWSKIELHMRELFWSNSLETSQLRIIFIMMLYLGTSEYHCGVLNIDPFPLARIGARNALEDHPMGMDSVGSVSSQSSVAA